MIDANRFLFQSCELCAPTELRLKVLGMIIFSVVSSIPIFQQSIVLFLCVFPSLAEKTPLSQAIPWMVRLAKTFEAFGIFVIFVQSPKPMRHHTVPYYFYSIDATLSFWHFLTEVRIYVNKPNPHSNSKSRQLFESCEGLIYPNPNPPIPMWDRKSHRMPRCYATQFMSNDLRISSEFNSNCYTTVRLTNPWKSLYERLNLEKVFGLWLHLYDRNGEVRGYESGANNFERTCKKRPQ